MTRKLALVLLAVSLAAGAWAMGGKPDLGTGSETGGQAIDFSLSDLTGQGMRLSDLHGKVVFLNFFASWCPPCRNEMPSMQALYSKLKGRDFEMLAVSVDRDQSKLKAFLAKNKFTFKILRDADGVVASQYNVGGIPATFIVDKKGKLAGSFVGGRDWAEPASIEMLKQLMRK